MLREIGLHFSQPIVWVREQPVITHKDFAGSHELALYGWRAGAAHRFYGPPDALDVWTDLELGSARTRPASEKPIELAARALEYSSRPGGNVLDLFGGSGITLIAAEQTERKAFVMEANPAYCDVIVTRWERLAGEEAVRTRR